jgi:type II secretory pathway pseudopilin PulG
MAVMLLVALLVVLLLAAVLAPWLGTDTSDARSESAHPAQGWFPLITRR